MTMIDSKEIITSLDKLIPNPVCELEYNLDYELLIATVLSAQSTDKRVNMVTKELFKVAPTPEKMLELGEARLKQIIHSCGFYNNKSKSIISATKSIISKYSGNVPNSMEELSLLSGVGRKTANVVLAEAFNKPAIAVDTHVLRVSKRLGLTSSNSTPEKCEQDLLKLVPSTNQAKFHIQTVFFGRYFCKAIKPECENCKLKTICKRK